MIVEDWIAQRSKGEMRPDAIGNAIMIAKIATGEIVDTTTEGACAARPGRSGGPFASRQDSAPEQQSRASGTRKVAGKARP